MSLTYWKNVNICFLFIGKYLVVSRDGHEIVDLLNPMAKYQLLVNNVPRVDFATGGLLQNSPIEKPPFWEPENMKISPAKIHKSVGKKLGQSPSRD